MTGVETHLRGTDARQPNLRRLYRGGAQREAYTDDHSDGQKNAKFLSSLSPLDVLFDGAAHDEAVDRRRSRLAAPVHAVHRLGFHGSIEQRLQEEHVVGFDLG